MRTLSILAVWLLASLSIRAEIIVAEGEAFQPQDQKGWKLTHQNHTYGSHTYGGMWMTHGACLGAPADSVGSVAVHPITVAKAGAYRVWSKYQAPPYFNYLHTIEVRQNGKVVFAHTYGKAGTDRLWSFSGQSDELWWPWGTDHDAAESPKTFAQLEAGPAEVRLITEKSPAPAGDRFVDVVILTTEPNDTYQGFKPYRVGSPFALEALAATKLYVRYRHQAAKESPLTITRNGHFQPNYGGAIEKFGRAAAGVWSEWINFGPFLRLVHDEGILFRVDGSPKVDLEFSRDPEGKDRVGAVSVAPDEYVIVPMEITWKRDARIARSEDRARDIIAQSKQWRKANGGKRPTQLLFYGAFRHPSDWAQELKYTLGYNTELPERYEQVPDTAYHAHVFGLDAIRKFAAASKKKYHIISFGDEIGLGRVSVKDPQVKAKFKQWLSERGITAAELGMPIEQAEPNFDSPARLAWYTTKFSEQQQFALFKANTDLVKELFGPKTLTGANYSPHHHALYYGPLYQWIDMFKYNGMSMIWAEDYIFSVPEIPQIISFNFAQMRCGAKYNNQPIHYYVMPHAPGQPAEYLRRNMVFSVGAGARHIDNFWVAPPEVFTENYVSYSYPDSYRAISESIFDAAEAERFAVGGKVRPGRVAVVLSGATDYNESRLMVEKSKDPFTARCKNAPAKINQILCRKDQQMLYTALRHAQHGVDLITEDDIVELGSLKDYAVVYFAGEWVDSRIISKLDEWVRAGGTLVATAGLGHRNQFDEPETGLAKLLGLKGSVLQKNAISIRTLLELPLFPPIDTITFADDPKASVPAIGMRQALQPDTAKVIARFQDGTPAVTQHTLGKGQAIAIGTLAGVSWMKTGLRVIPFARGGYHTVYNPTDHSPAAKRLVGLPFESVKVPQEAATSVPGVEATVIDHPQTGSLVTLVNWTNSPQKNVEVAVRLPQAPSGVRSVQQQRALESQYADGVVRFRVDLTEADFILLPK
jgi:hypothetical protein